jgi:regulator of sigma E protease
MTILYFLILLSIIVVIHEWGHLITAKLFHVYCYEFSFGMGPLLWKRQKGETQYSIRALPIGGYVSMAGEPDGDEAYPDIHVDPQRTMNGIAPWKKIIIMLAGVFMNFMLAWVIISMVLLSNGSYSLAPKPVVDSVVAGSPAETAGFEAGDVIKAVQFSDGTVIHPKTFYDIVTFSNSETGEMTYTVERGSTVLELKVTPVFDEESQAYKIGLKIPDGETVSINLLNCWGYGAGYLADTTREMLTSIVRLFRGTGLNQLSGPVGIYTVTKQTVAMGFKSFLILVAILSLNVGIFNLLPLPVLDGGRVVITIGEWIAHKPLNKKVETGLMTACWALLIALMIFVTWNDITRLVSGS